MLSESLLLNNNKNNDNPVRDRVAKTVTPVNDVPSTSLKTKTAASASASAVTATVRENFPAAALFYLISMAFSASQSIFGKVLYREQPLLTPF